MGDVPQEREPRRKLGVSYAERSSNPPPGLTWWKVNRQATFGQVADQFNIRWTDLALHNFRTTQLAAINWYLHHWVGCTSHDGRRYQFTGNEAPGQLLVPDRSGATTVPCPTEVDVVRGGCATRNTPPFQVRVMDLRPTGARVEVSGKWLYVFSGGGVDYGVSSNVYPIDSTSQYCFRHPPDRLDFEILVTPQAAPAREVVRGILGAGKIDPGRFEYGSKWYFLSDPVILGDATSAARHTRNTHASLGSDLIPLDLSQDRRYYFLLSPVQLGPAAIRWAMDHPEALMPLEAPGRNAAKWDPANAADPDPYSCVGPRADDFPQTPMILVLGVIDPYAWAEDLVHEVYADAIEQYYNWINREQDPIIEQLNGRTGWDISKYVLAKLLKEVRDKQKNPDEINDVIAHRADWERNLEDWERNVTERNTEMLDRMSSTISAILDYLDGSAHFTIDLALRKDADQENPEDGLDIALGIWHWAVCTEYLIGSEPGLVYLRNLFCRQDNFLYENLFRYLDDAQAGRGVQFGASSRKAVSLRGTCGVFLLLAALRDFVSDPPALNWSPDADEYSRQLGAFIEKRRAGVLDFINRNGLLPDPANATLEGPEPQDFSEEPSAITRWGPFVNSLLDYTDKANAWFTDPGYRVPPEHLTPSTQRIAKTQQFFARSPRLSFSVSLFTKVGVKGSGLVVNFYNFFQVFTKARWDYQHRVPWTDSTAAVAGAYPALYDVLTELKIFFGARWERLFPDLIDPKCEPWWSAGPRLLKGGARFFGGVAAVANIIAGFLTAVSTGRQAVRAQAVGDTAAAVLYGVSVAGSAVATGGAIIFGESLLILAVSGVTLGPLATIGLVLMAIGTLVSILFGLIAGTQESNEYVIFARKCFLGKDAGDEPRFGQHPPRWSGASKQAGDSWPVERQWQALLTLLRRFQVATAGTMPMISGSPEYLDFPVYQGSIELTVEMGLNFPQGTSVEIGLQVEEAKLGPATSASVVLSGRPDVALLQPTGSLFLPGASSAQFKYDGGWLKQILFVLATNKVQTDHARLIATIRFCPPGETPVAARLLAASLGGPQGWEPRFPTGKTTADLFE